MKSRLAQILRGVLVPGTGSRTTPNGCLFHIIEDTFFTLHLHTAAFLALKHLTIRNKLNKYGCI